MDIEQLILEAFNAIHISAIRRSLRGKRGWNPVLGISALGGWIRREACLDLYLPGRSRATLGYLRPNNNWIDRYEFMMAYGTYYATTTATLNTITHLKYRMAPGPKENVYDEPFQLAATEVHPPRDSTN